MKSNEAKSVELPDDAEITGGANYDAVVSPNEMLDPAEAGIHYCWAAKNDRQHPSGVPALESQGYKLSTKKHRSLDCVLMEIPQRVVDQRERQRQEREVEVRRAALRSSAIPGQSVQTFDNHGQFGKAK